MGEVGLELFIWRGESERKNIHDRLIKEQKQASGCREGSEYSVDQRGGFLLESSRKSGCRDIVTTL